MQHEKNWQIVPQILLKYKYNISANFHHFYISHICNLSLFRLFTFKKAGSDGFQKSKKERDNELIYARRKNVSLFPSARNA